MARVLTVRLVMPVKKGFMVFIIVQLFKALPVMLQVLSAIKEMNKKKDVQTK